MCVVQRGKGLVVVGALLCRHWCIYGGLGQHVECVHFMVSMMRNLVFTSIFERE